MTERNGEIWRLYCSGVIQEEIAERFGISQPRVAEIITAIRVKLGPVDREEVRRRHMEQLARMQAHAAEIVESPPVPMYRGSERVMDIVDGQEVPVVDHAGRLAAMAMVVKLQEREAKLTGADAPTQIDATSTVRYEVAGVDTGELT